MSTAAPLEATALPIARVWAAIGLPVGFFIGLLSLMSDHSGERSVGLVALGLAAASAAIAASALTGRRTTEQRHRLSLALSGLWAAGGIYAAVVLRFAADRLLFGGAFLVVAAVTALVVLRRRSDGSPESTDTQPHGDQAAG